MRTNAAQTTTHTNGISKVKQRFEDWRKHRRRGEHIPPALWLAAMDLANVHGVERIAQELRLGPGRLAKRLTIALKKTNKLPKAKAPLAARSAFVELMTPKASGMGECVVELSNARGANMRMQFQGGDMASLVSVMHAFWNAS
jgi:hypothetical protein